MREALLGLIVAVLCVVAIFKPRWGLYAYCWFALMRPDYLAWAAGDKPFSLALAICTLVGGFHYLFRAGRWLQTPFTALLLLLQVPIFISVVFAQDSRLAWTPYNMYLRVILMAMLIPLVIDEVEHFRELFIIVAFSIGFLGAKWGLGGILHGGANYQSGYGGFLSDNNCVALAFAMVIPLCWYCRSIVSQKWAKWMFMVMVFGSIAGVVWTHSRGGALSVAVVMIMLSWRTKYKVPALLGLVLLAAPAIYLVRDSYFHRMETLENVEEDNSAMSRIVYGKAAVAMWKDHPIFGVGYGAANFQALLSYYLGRPDHHVAHDTYLQMLVDSGIFAFLIYVVMVVYSIIWLGKSAKRMRKLKPELAVYPLGLQGALVAFAVGSTFLSRVAFDFYYMLLMMAASWYQLEQMILRASSEVAPAQRTKVIVYSRPRKAVPAGVSFVR